MPLELRADRCVSKLELTWVKRLLSCCVRDRSSWKSRESLLALWSAERIGLKELTDCGTRSKREGRDQLLNVLSLLITAFPLRASCCVNALKCLRGQGRSERDYVKGSKDVNQWRSSGSASSELIAQSNVQDWSSLGRWRGLVDACSLNELLLLRWWSEKSYWVRVRSDLRGHPGCWLWRSTFKVESNHHCREERAIRLKSDVGPVEWSRGCMERGRVGWDGSSWKRRVKWKRDDLPWEFERPLFKISNYNRKSRERLLIA